MNLQHVYFEMTHKTPKRLPFLLADGKEKVGAFSRPSATLKLSNELLAKLLERINGV